MNSTFNDTAEPASSSEATASAALRLDPVLTTALAVASLAAYNDFERITYAVPSGYSVLGRFTGWDEWLFDYGIEERFGLIFKSQSVPGRFIVAFRGTDSDSDALEDAFFEYASFKPYRNAVTPIPDDVSSGFNGIYTGLGGDMTQTMQQQIFAMLQSQPLNEVFITGHSLGGALSQLFTLDMRVSLPHVTLRTINFASPKVGAKNWQRACINAGAVQKITRIINYWDLVPDLPVSIDIWDQYVALGAEFQTAFRGNALFDELPRHRLLNLMFVLKKCLPLTPQIWVGTFQDAVNHTYTMTSTPPPSQGKEKILAKVRELKSLERAVHSGSGRKEPYLPYGESTAIDVAD